MPLSLEHKDLSIEIKSWNGIYRYVRAARDEKVEKVLGARHGKIIVHPVEPVTLPKEITRYLEIEFDLVVVAPRTEQVIFLKFPIEIGVFIEEDDSMDLLDLISLAPQKFSLYGNPRTGVITRYARSPTYLMPPEVDPLVEGVLKLTISNPLESNIEVSRVVLESHAMMLYYSSYASMVASLQIVNSRMGETYFTDEPLEPGMKRAIELYKVRKLPIPGLEKAIVIRGVEYKVFTMEWGLT